MQRENPRERVTQIKAEPKGPGWRWGEGTGLKWEGGGEAEGRRQSEWWGKWREMTKGWWRRKWDCRDGKGTEAQAQAMTQTETGQARGRDNAGRESTLHTLCQPTSLSPQGP